MVFRYWYPSGAIRNITISLLAFRNVVRSIFVRYLDDGILYLVAGYYAFSTPVKTAIVLTNILAIFLIIAGVIRSVNAFILKPLIGWGWILLSGLLTLATGIIILMSPDAPFWVLGLFLAVDILFQGVNYLTLAAAIKRIPKSSADV